MFGVLTKIFGSKNERFIKKLQSVVDEINAFEPELTSLSEVDLRRRFDECREKAMDISNLDELLVEVFAIVREVSKRQLLMRHFDVQLIGGIVLHQGKIAEMKTGEGKTLVATLAVVLNALKGEGVHVVTVNDYLAKRDARWMGPIYHFLGLSVGVIQHESSFLYDPEYISEDVSLENLRPISRQDAYGTDITYGTNNEFGFDYLRDNMRYDIVDFVQRGFNFAIVDEVDSILIDEARTPLIISGPSEEKTGKYYEIDKIIPNIKPDEYVIDEKAKTVNLTEEGVARVESLLKINNLFDPDHIETLHHVNQALRAHTLFKRDVDYLVKDNEVIIVDEFTGRLMPGRRWSDGLHQAIEAKEGVKIESENQTLATITFQNLFRMYKKLAGMTGTADTEAPEFAKIYNLDVVVIPTNEPMARIDYSDVIYKTQKAKFNAVINEIEYCYKRKQPVLVGTVTIENSEKLHLFLENKKIPHSVLNAKFHEKEAEIIVQAGRSSSVTIATNMAGRGTDIVLGGNPEGLAKLELKGAQHYTEEDYQRALQKARETCEVDKQGVLSAGGLHIIGTERHEARRIDNQLRGRSGRQGDPGSSRFYLSLEDDLMRIFGSDRISNIMGKLGMEEDVPIEHKFISKAVENAQKKVEAHNFEIRKHLLEYDDVMNQQRTEIYNFRRYILQSESIKARITEMSENVLDDLLDQYLPEDKDWDKQDINGLTNGVYGVFAFKPDFNDSQNIDEIRDSISAQLKENFDRKDKELAESLLRYHERLNRLTFLDRQWINYPLMRQDMLKSISSEDDSMAMSEKIVENIIERYLPGGNGISEASLDKAIDEIYNIFGFKPKLKDNNAVELKKSILREINDFYKQKEERHAENLLRYYEKIVAFYDISLFDKVDGAFQAKNTRWKELLLYRRNIIDNEDIRKQLLNKADDVVEDILFQSYLENKSWNKSTLKKLQNRLFAIFNVKKIEFEPDEKTDIIELKDKILKQVREQLMELQLAENILHYYEKLLFLEILRYHRIVALQVLDSQWKDHLLAMDHLKEGIGLRGYGQRDPIVEYKKEAFIMFSALGDRIENKIVSQLYHIQTPKEREEERRQRRAFNPDNYQYNRSDGGDGGSKTVVKRKKVGRNEPCPCGSGKKYKKCCMLKAK